MTSFYPTLNTPTTTYTVQPGCGFLDPLYLKALGSQHPAEDFNAISGADTDLGDPVHAADDGEVLATGYDGYIGGMVEIRHADGSTSGYWHLRDIHVKKGQRVEGGDFIGQIGSGGPRSKMLAHLHFYVKRPGVNLPLIYWPSTHEKDPTKCAAFIRANYFQPGEWLKARGAKRTLADLQGQHGEPARLLIDRGDGPVDVTGQLVQLSGNGVTLDARTATIRAYVNDVHPASVPALPPQP
ncbi:M23 family metallopeptidase [Deinococcus sp. SM5_A1]|uniref:M23 family metallopeptidase n=1 Tax=Deinococcus sp. SM5_A1 TaxID=3379094 RepID=UPI00385D0693